MIYFKRSAARKAVTRASVCVLGALVAVGATGFGVTGCDRDGTFNIRNLFGVGSLGPALLSDDSADGDGTQTPSDGAEPGQSARGADGVSCWDLNANGKVEVESEDINGDGRVDVLDCRGGGGQGGANGRSCWDLNGNGAGDVQSEDTNGDGVVDVFDCGGLAGAEGLDGSNGSDGSDGSDGVSGLNCWDSNGNGVADPAEDANGDGLWNASDCQGLRGTSGGSGSSGATGANGQDGAAGLACWDLNGNGEADLGTEDTNGNGVVDVLDCRGDSGGGGAGQDGMDGLNCWDLNENGVEDLDTEDLNGDGVVNVLDCQGNSEGGGSNGQDGADGLACWDLNENGVQDPDTEDGNGDGVVNVLDCRGTDGTDGAAGADGEDGEDGGPGGAAGSLLFDTFVDDFFTVANGSYDAVPFGGDTLPVVEIVDPAMGACGGESGSVDVLGFRAAVPPWYGAGNPVTMRLFIWRTGPQGYNCFLFRLDAFRARHGTGAMRYGEPRYILLDDPGSPDPSGALLAVDLPLNNGNNNLAQGLALPDDLAGGDLLAFEFNSVAGFDDGGCFTIIGVEFFESPSDSDVAVVHAIAMQTLQGVSCGGGMMDCNQNFIDDAIDTGAAPPAGMVVVCHVPVTDPTHPMTLVVPMSYLNGHLTHGDSIGPCSDDCNNNGIPDECEIDSNSTAKGGPFYCGPDCVDCSVVCDPDCNDNGKPDACEEPEGPNCG